MPPGPDAGVLVCGKEADATDSSGSGEPLRLGGSVSSVMTELAMDAVEKVESVVLLLLGGRALKALAALEVLSIESLRDISSKSMLRMATPFSVKPERGEEVV